MEAGNFSASVTAGTALDSGAEIHPALRREMTRSIAMHMTDRHTLMMGILPLKEYLFLPYNTQLFGLPAEGMTRRPFPLTRGETLLH